MIAEGATTVITGTLGGGKTLAGADIGMEHLSEGGTVITNIPMYRDKLRKWLADEWGKVMDDGRLVLLNQASIRDFQDLAKRGGPKKTVMMILDEAALDIGSRDWKTQADETFNFVVLCRKLYIHLVLIAQDANDIDKRIRQKMQTEIHCRSLMNVGMLKDLVRLPVFIRVTYTIELGKKPWRTGAKFHYKAQSWGMFDSHALHGKKAKEFEALELAAQDDLQPINQEKAPYVAIVATSGVISSSVTTWLLLNS